MNKQYITIRAAFDNVSGFVEMYVRHSTLMISAAKEMLLDRVNEARLALKDKDWLKMVFVTSELRGMMRITGMFEDIRIEYVTGMLYQAIDLTQK